MKKEMNFENDMFNVANLVARAKMMQFANVEVFL